MFDKEEVKREGKVLADYFISLTKKDWSTKSSLNQLHSDMTHNKGVLDALPTHTRQNYLAICWMQYVIEGLEVLIEEQKKVQPDPMNRMR